MNRDQYLMKGRMLGHFDENDSQSEVPEKTHGHHSPHDKLSSDIAQFLDDSEKYMLGHN